MTASSPPNPPHDANPLNDPLSIRGRHRAPSDAPFLSCLLVLSFSYVALIAAMIIADLSFTSLPKFFSELPKNGFLEAVRVAFSDFTKAFAKEEIRFAIVLSLVSCTLSAILSVFIAVPIGYLMSRYRFWGKPFVDAVLDIPIVLPPLVIGISLLILFQTGVGRWFESIILAMINRSVAWTLVALVGAFLIAWLLRRLIRRWTQRAVDQERDVIPSVEAMAALLPTILFVALVVLSQLEGIASPIESQLSSAADFLGKTFNDAVQWMGAGRIRGVTYDVPAVILAQFAVACAFAVRTMRVTYDQIDERRERVAMTLGCSRSQAFFKVVLPESRPGVLTAGTLAWARSMGEFGPILVFAGATRLKTEVLPTTVFLELSVGDINAAVAVSMIMVTAAVVVLILARYFGNGRGYF